ncbi:MAG: peptidase M48, partial [Desulfobacterales bacterium]|nr:peptidase M48 [Desulfobacterales bacterium]
MKIETRRDFLGAALTLGAAGFFMAGCQAADTVIHVAGATLPVSTDQAQSLVEVGQAVMKTFESFTPEQEYYMGRTISAMVLDKYPAFDNGPANDYVNLVGQTLAAASDRPDTFGGYRFQIQDSDEINAF